MVCFPITYTESEFLQLVEHKNEEVLDTQI